MENIGLYVTYFVFGGLLAWLGIAFAVVLYKFIKEIVD